MQVSEALEKCSCMKEDIYMLLVTTDRGLKFGRLLVAEGKVSGVAFEPPHSFVGFVDSHYTRAVVYQASLNLSSADNIEHRCCCHTAYVGVEKWPYKKVSIFC